MQGKSQCGIPAYTVPDYTLAQLRSLMPSVCFVPQASITQQNTAINRARQRIFTATQGGGWKGGDASLTLVIAEDSSARQFVTMPFGFESIVGVYGTSGDYLLQNEWFGFTRVAPNQANYGQGSTMRDLGSGYNTFLDVPSTTGLNPIFTTEGPATITIIGFNLAGDFVNEQVVLLAAGTQAAVNTYVQIVSLEIAANTATASNVTYVTAPTSFTDFTMFPNNVVPSQGTYIASDGLNFWIIKAGSTQWRKADLLSS